MLNKFQKTYLRKLSALELSNKNRQPGKRTCTKYVYISWSFHAQEGWFGALDSQCRPHSHSAPGSWTSPSSIYPPEETSHSWSAHSPTPRLCPGPRQARWPPPFPDWRLNGAGVLPEPLFRKWNWPLTLQKPGLSHLSMQSWGQNNHGLFKAYSRRRMKLAKNEESSCPP
jgi:hypothetical protein